MLSYNHCLKKRPSKWVSGQLRTVRNAKKITRQANIEKVQFRRLYKTLVNVFMPWLQHPHDIARLKNRQPSRRDFRCDPHIVRQ